MQCPSLSPSWLPARGGVEGKDQACLTLRNRLNGTGLPEKCRNVARAGAVKIFWNERDLGGAGCEQSAIAELTKVMASACQLGYHGVEGLLIEGQAVTVALAADQFHQFAA